jgi:UDPglucose 6-dehydrogenase/UDP-N-acetyl-D-galactosamine dehydrogenase
MLRESVNTKTVCVIGVGYVGLPLAEAFAEHLKVIGFDVNQRQLEFLPEG